MNRIAKFVAGSLLAVATGAALAAGSPGVERNTQAFLDALAAGGGKPLETLSPAEARAVLVGAQAAPRCRCRRPTSARRPSTWTASRSA